MIFAMPICNLIAAFVFSTICVFSAGGTDTAGFGEKQEQGIFHGVFGDAVALKVPPQGWSFEWNAEGDIEKPQTFAPLTCIETTSGRRTNLEWGVTGDDGKLLQDYPWFSGAGDAMGVRIADGTARFAIAAFTLPTEPVGEIWIQNGNLRNNSVVMLEILINGKRKTSWLTPKDREPFLFQENLGPLKKGDVIQVVVRPGTESANRFGRMGGRLRFVIAEYPAGITPAPPVNILSPPLGASEPQRDAAGGFANYMAKHEALCQEVVERRPELVFIGDSITVRWPRELLEKHFGQFRPVNLGIGGDWIQNVRWRIENGALDKAPVRVAVLLIGTNNLSNNFTPAEVAQGTLDLASLLREKVPGCKVLIVGILPRGDSIKDPRNDIIRETNALVAAAVDAKDIFFLDVGSSLIEPDGRLDPEVFPDKLHVALPGYIRMLGPLEPVLKSILSGEPLKN